MVLPVGALAATTAVPIDLSTSVQASDIVLFGPPGCLPPPASLGGPGPDTYSYGETSVITSAAGNHVLEIVDLVTPLGAPADPVILLYQGGAFNPAAPADNLVACDDNGNVDPSLSPAFSRLVVPASTTYTVVVLVPRDAGFAPGTSTATLSSALEPTITFANKSIALGATGEFMTATSNSSGTISYDLLNPTVALIDPSTGALTTFSAGSTPVRALQARDGVTYGSGVKEATLTVTAVAPTVTGIAPANGPTAGSTAVTVTGTDFGGATSVTIGGAAATNVVVTNATTITAITPAGTAGARDVSVTTPGGTGTGTGLFTYVAPVVATKLGLTTQPAGAMAGTAFTTQPVVAIQDADGNTVASSTAAVTLAIKPGTGTTGAALQTCTSTTAVAGVATFSGCKIDLAGTGYILTASAAGLTSADSAAFSVAAPPIATKLAFTTLPPATVAAGTRFTVVVTAQDAANLVSVGHRGAVTITTGDPTKLKGLLVANLVNGVATFTGLNFTQAGTYTLVASKVGLTSATSSAVTVSAPATASYLAFTSAPDFEVSGTAFAKQPVVKAFSADGKVFPFFTQTVALTVSPAPGTATSPTLGPISTTTVGSVGGQASFSGIHATAPPGTYVLTATAGALSASTTFNVYADATTAATARSTERVQSVKFVLKFVVDDVVINTTSFASQLKADLREALSDPALAARVSVRTVSASASPKAASAAKNACPAVVTGVGEVTVPDCMYSAPGTYRLEATSPGFPTTTSNLFTVVDTLAGNLPGAPRNVTVQTADGQAVVSWDRPESTGAGHIVAYEVIGIRAGFPDQSLAKGLLTSKTLKLANGSEWRFGVKALNALGGGEMAQSNLVTIGAPSGAPKALGVPKLAVGGCTLQRSETIGVGPEEGPGTGAVMTYGATGLELTDCPGGVANVTLDYPVPVQDMQVYTQVDGRWSMMAPATPGLVLAGNSATFAVADNGPSDADPQVGVISIVAGVGDLTGTFISSFSPDTIIPRLANISTRGQVLTGNDVMIGGFVIGGATNKTVVVRARGPSLVPFGITNALANPQLQLVRSSDQATLATNDDWGGASNAAAITSSGFAPDNALESAILASLPPGAYTAIVSGVGSGTGVGIVEVFEVDEPATPLTNISTRGQVLTANDVMIGGFVVQGSGPQTVVVRARGPSLVPFGITNALANPQLQLVRSSDQVTIATNDDWGSAGNAAAITSSGFAPDNALESAILITLDPGAYTAIVTGAGGTTGVGIIEVFTQ